MVTRRIENIAGKLSSEKAKVRRQTGSLTKAAEGAAKKLGAVRSELDKRLVKGSPESIALESLEVELSNCV